MKTLSEFLYALSPEDFDDAEDARSYLTTVMNMMLDENKHFGDCVKECNACLMCEITALLNDYWEYTKLNR